MTAFDLLVDFAALTSCSEVTAANSQVIGSNHDRINSIPTAPVLLEESLAAGSVMLELLRDSVMTVDCFDRPQCPPSPAMLRGALLTYVAQSHEYALQERGLPVGYQPWW
jgi:hypothetical protein